VTGRLQTVFARLKWVGARLAAPLRRNEGPNKFRLSSMDTATTTIDGSVGWGNRPPAFLECPRCSEEIYQHNAHDGIDCPHCVAEFDSEEFADLELCYMQCPVCRSRMRHGNRHPEQFDFPEWATCDGCRYHWEFEHSYDRL
jgi:DNA-directed RNA polymerase subunit RPC12/RpoP